MTFFCFARCLPRFVCVFFGRFFFTASGPLRERNCTDCSHFLLFFYASQWIFTLFSPIFHVFSRIFSGFFGFFLPLFFSAVFFIVFICFFPVCNIFPSRIFCFSSIFPDFSVLYQLLSHSQAKKGIWIIQYPWNGKMESGPRPFMGEPSNSCHCIVSRPDCGNRSVQVRRAGYGKYLAGQRYVFHDHTA